MCVMPLGVWALEDNLSGVSSVSCLGVGGSHLGNQVCLGSHFAGPASSVFLKSRIIFHRSVSTFVYLSLFCSPVTVSNAPDMKCEPLQPPAVSSRETAPVRGPARSRDHSFSRGHRNITVVVFFL